MSDAPLHIALLVDTRVPLIRDAWPALHSAMDAVDGMDAHVVEVTDEAENTRVDADLIVVPGGDGAILRACRQLRAHQLPILGVNLGRLGFLADLSPEEFAGSLDAIRSRQYSVTDHLMFECEHRGADGNVEQFIGLNEVAVSSAGTLRMLEVQLSIDDETVTTFRGDGVIVSTPVGSTAHSLSAGGPILRQELRSFVITPICPHTLTVRPIVDSASRVYSVSVPNASEGVMVVVDGQIRRPVREGDVIEVRQAPFSFLLARPSGHSYYATLRRKLGWGGQLRYRR